jgi:hypothetical protein
MNEAAIVNDIVTALKVSGFRVATEVPNLYRSADVAALDNEGNIWIVECKISNIGRAIIQSKTHKLSADKVFIGIPFRNAREDTLNRIRNAGLGLIYVMPDGSIDMIIEEEQIGNPWQPAKDKLRQRILEAV